jgi:uncharacterized protein YoxC
MPGWVGPVAAISLVFIALAFVAMAVAVVLITGRLARQIDGLQRKVAELKTEITPTLQSVARVADTAQQLSGRVRDEVEQILLTSKDVRRGVRRGVRRVRRRLEELDALYEVVHEEVEDTALDVAAAIRTVRTGSGALGRIRRLLVRGRR